MNQEEVAELIASVNHWHHTILFPYGLCSPGAQDSNTLLSYLDIPVSLDRKVCLDLGCRDGFFSFELEKRGASSVLGIDYIDENDTGFAAAKKILGSEVSFRNMGVYQINPESLGEFDLILFLGLIYHLRHPLLALDRCWDCLKVGGDVVIESHIIDGGFVEDGVWIKLPEPLKTAKIAQFYEHGELAGDPTSPVAPSLECLKAWVRTSGFEIISSWAVGFRGGVRARKILLPPNHPRFMDTANKISVGFDTVKSEGVV